MTNAKKVKIPGESQLFGFMVWLTQGDIIEPFIKRLIAKYGYKFFTAVLSPTSFGEATDFDCGFSKTAYQGVGGRVQKGEQYGTIEKVLGKKNTFMVKWDNAQESKKVTVKPQPEKEEDKKKAKKKEDKKKAKNEIHPVKMEERKFVKSCEDPTLGYMGHYTRKIAKTLSAPTPKASGIVGRTLSAVSNLHPVTGAASLINAAFENMDIDKGTAEGCSKLYMRSLSTGNYVPCAWVPKEGAMYTRETWKWTENKLQLDTATHRQKNQARRRWNRHKGYPIRLACEKKTDVNCKWQIGNEIRFPHQSDLTDDDNLRISLENDELKGPFEISDRNGKTQGKNKHFDAKKVESFGVCAARPLNKCRLPEPINCMRTHPIIRFKCKPTVYNTFLTVETCNKSQQFTTSQQRYMPCKCLEEGPVYESGKLKGRTRCNKCRPDWFVTCAKKPSENAKLERCKKLNLSGLYVGDHSSIKRKNSINSLSRLRCEDMEKSTCDLSYEVTQAGKLKHRMVPCQWHEAPENKCVTPGHWTLLGLDKTDASSCDLFQCPKDMTFEKHKHRKDFCKYEDWTYYSWRRKKLKEGNNSIKRTKESCMKVGFLLDNGVFKSDVGKMKAKGYAYPCYWQRDSNAISDGKFDLADEKGTCIGSVNRVAPCFAPKKGEKEYEKNIK